MREAVPLFKQRGARGVILDVRFNSGGSDFIGMTVASHFFTAAASLGFRKQSRLPMAPRAAILARTIRWRGRTTQSTP